jgi:hypothetical protein
MVLPALRWIASKMPDFYPVPSTTSALILGDYVGKTTFEEI